MEPLIYTEPLLAKLSKSLPLKRLYIFATLGSRRVCGREEGAIVYFKGIVLMPFSASVSTMYLRWQAVVKPLRVFWGHNT